MNHHNSMLQSDSEKQHSKQILIIEESESLNILYKSILLQSNHIILTASSGQEALEKLDSFQPNLIITAEILSDMTSSELQSYVKAKNNCSHTSILVLSKQRRHLLHARSPKPRSAKINSPNILHLPFKIADFRQSVERFLDSNDTHTEEYYYPSRQYLSQQSESAAK